ncbi:carbohydrate binding-domain-containing protein [Mycena crocata]|nr:carbohydrate binding-domain-containing protein [Mycena crocata]
MARLLSFVFTALIATVAAGESCGTADYDPSQYTCLDGSLLCPIVNGEGYIGCSGVCYSASQYSCTNGELSPIASRDDCVPNFGDSVVCNDQGCFQLVCCPGLISIANKCRDPCDVAPSSCA